MAETQIRKGLAGLTPQDFIEAGSVPKRFRGLVKSARYIPRPLKKDGVKCGFFAALKLEDLETDQEHVLYYRAGWLPRQFEDGRIVGTMPTNDGPDVEDDDREPTAKMAFFMALGDGSKSIPADVDAIEEYGGTYAMGDLMTNNEPFYAFVVALAECEFPFPDQSIASLEGWTFTLESAKIGTYTKDGTEKDIKAHLPTEIEPPTKKSKKSTAAVTETAKKKSKPAADDEEEEKPAAKAKGKADAATTAKKKPAPEPEEEEEEETEEEEGGPTEVLHTVIVGILKKKPNREMPEGQVLIEAMKAPEFRELSQKDRKAAVNAYNDRSLFEESDVLILDEEEDTVSLKASAKKK